MIHTMRYLCVYIIYIYTYIYTHKYVYIYIKNGQTIADNFKVNLVRTYFYKIFTLGPQKHDNGRLAVSDYSSNYDQLANDV